MATSPLKGQVAEAVASPSPTPPRRTLRSATKTSTAAAPPAVPTTLQSPLDVPPSVDTGPPPSDTQHSSPSLLSHTQAPGSDGFVTVTSARGRGTTTAAAAFLPPATVGVPLENPPNAFAALDDTSSVGTPERHVDELRPFAGSVAADSESLQAILDKSFDEFFGPESPPAPTPLRIKGLFDAGARVVDRLLSEIHEDHHRHAARTDLLLASIKESAHFDRGALRADVTLLRTETEDALGPAFRNLSGLAAMVQKAEQDITGLLATSARTTHDMLALRQEIDGCVTLSGLADMARKSEQDILGMLETSSKNAQAILELRQELAECVAVKTTVDDIKTRQLTQIRDNITRVKTGLADMTTQYSTLDDKYSEAFDAVNIRVDNILREGIPPTAAPADDAATPPVRNTAPSTSSPPPDGTPSSPPAHMVPDSAPTGDGRMN